MSVVPTGPDPFPRVTVAEIQRMVAERYGLTREQMIGQSRARKIARPRQIAYLLAREYTDASLTKIGQFFQGRDHGTVHHGAKAVRLRVAESAAVARDVVEFRAVLTERIWAAGRGDLRW